MNAGLVAGLLGGALAVSFVLGCLCTGLACQLAPRIGFVDRPGAHKSHERVMPYGGGTAIFLAAWVPLLALLLAVHAWPTDWFTRLLGQSAGPLVGGLRLRAVQGEVILAGGLVLHLLGLLDDLRPLGAWPKLLTILAVGIAVAALGEVRMAVFLGPSASVVVTGLWIGVICNAFNFLDNMDGLSAGVAAICCAFFVACGLLAGQLLVPALGVVFLGAMLGFLVFNFPPARIYMGDAGSLLVGYMLAIVSVLTTYYESQAGDAPYALIMPLVILAVPLYDFTSVLVIRHAEGRSPLQGDQRHFSHRLVQHGLSRRLAVLTIYLATAATALSATLLPAASLSQTLTVAALVLLVLAIIAILESPVAPAP